MKKRILTISLSAVLALGFVVIFVAGIFSQMCWCSYCSKWYDDNPQKMFGWSYMPLHYHLKGDDWNSLHESPESYFEQEMKKNEDGEEVPVKGSFLFRGYGSGDVKIPKTINGETVNRVSFNGACWNVTGVYFPDGITSIPEGCFIPNVMPYPSSQFADHYIEKVYIPSSVTEIGSHAFSETNLKSISVPDSVTEIGESAFKDCKSLTNADLSNSLTKIENDLFNGCESLTSITIPNSLIEIGDNAFADCTSLTSITTPVDKINISDTAFSGCTGLRNITISDGVTKIPENCFATQNKSAFSDLKIEQIIIPDSVTVIGDYAFDNCTGLKSINIPNGVTEIGLNAFKNCTNLTNITYMGITYSYTSLTELYLAIAINNETNK